MSIMNIFSFSDFGERKLSAGYKTSSTLTLLVPCYLPPFLSPSKVQHPRMKNLLTRFFAFRDTSLWIFLLLVPQLSYLKFLCCLDVRQYFVPNLLYWYFSSLNSN